MIKTVTITGADDSVVPEQIIQLSDAYPFVEWARGETRVLLV